MHRIVWKRPRNSPSYPFPFRAISKIAGRTSCPILTPPTKGMTRTSVCKLDRDLADSLDDCDIQGRCRSDLVNAIVRAFFGAFLPQLARYRREKKSLFTNYKEA